MIKIKNFLEQIIMFFKIGYFCPKYVFLANIANNDKDNHDKMNNALWNASVQYLHKGDKIFDALYVAIYEFKILQKIMKEEGENNE